MLNGKSILITGGTGSFAKKCTEVILKNYKPKRLVIFSRDEFKQSEMSRIFSEEQYPCIRYFLGDIRDKNRLYRAFADIDYVIHAAALKQVPALEYNPFEAVQTNIIGTENIINAAIDNNVKKIIALSTDKAVAPVNLYGATKLCSEKLFVAGNAYSGMHRTKMSVVRYGNVVGSRGSVVPFFLKQKKEGVLPITDPRMTRFWITLDQGVSFVLDALNRMLGGEVFIPKIPSMNIMDLATAIGPECQTKIVGIRPGEKLHEILIINDEARRTVEFDNYYIVKPTFDWGADENDMLKKGKLLTDDFCYVSNTNTHWLTVKELKDIINVSSI